VALHVLVLAGGTGTRLWPLSRAERPKHLLPLGPEETTLLRATVERVLPLTGSVHVVTTAAQAEGCREALDGVGPVSIIAEPAARGTGPALGLATAWLARRDPGAVICSVHADHHVGDAAAYRDAVLAAAGGAATTGGLATVGIIPTEPATAYGYVELGALQPPGRWQPPAAGIPAAAAAKARELPAHQVASFVEKPPLEVARGIAGDGKHLWNLGLFAWPAATFLEELQRVDSGLAGALEQVVSSRLAGDEAAATAGYGGVSACAVEPLLMEGSARLTVVTAAFPWSDLGAWPDIQVARQEAGDADPDGNVIDGDGIAVGSRDCLISAQGGRVVAVVGADHLIVVDTGDAVLVVPAAQAQRVKELTDRLAALGRAELR
jgi:mannose-1-phosphate guanylyltransferase